jgi:glucose/arabinose dehydrogenase
MIRRPVWFALLLLVVAALACSPFAGNAQSSDNASPEIAETNTPPAIPTDIPGSQPTESPATDTTPAPVSPVPGSDDPNSTAAPTTEPVPTQAQTLSPDDFFAFNITLEQVAGGFDTPIGVTNAGDGSGRLFVVEKPGRIIIVEGGARRSAPFLDISNRVQSSGSEQGLLGLAFHPNYAQNGIFFVNYTGFGGVTIVSRFEVTDDPYLASPSSEVEILRQEQPAANHNGGQLAFGPDGYLYIGLGDGGGAGDQYGNAQNGGTLLGSLVRVDINVTPYAIPQGNPFVGIPSVLDEIWATGLRNPWRFSFDRATGDLYIADVGQDSYEEVSYQPANSPGGENFGWPITEGRHCYNPNPCDQNGLTLPVVEYSRSGPHCSVIGGYVYRGSRYSQINGVYVFSDWCSGTIWGLNTTPGAGWPVRELLLTNRQITSFGEGDDGELYVVDMQGTLYRIVAQ